MGNIRFGLHREYPPFLICFLWVIVSFYFLVAIFEPFFLMHDPNAVDYTMKFAQPSIQYPFGCDQLGAVCVFPYYTRGKNKHRLCSVGCVYIMYMGNLFRDYFELLRRKGGSVD